MYKVSRGILCSTVAQFPWDCLNCNVCTMSCLYGWFFYLFFGLVFGLFTSRFATIAFRLKPEANKSTMCGFVRFCFMFHFGRGWGAFMYIVGCLYIFVYRLQDGEHGVITYD